MVDLGPLRCKGLYRLTGLINSIEERLRNPKIDLVELRPDLEVRLLAIVLDGFEKLINDERIILEENNLWIDCVDLLRELIESKPLLTRILNGRRILRNDTLGNLAMIGVSRMTLKSKVKNLDLGTQRRHLSKEILGNLGLSSGLIHMSTHKKNPH